MRLQESPDTTDTKAHSTTRNSKIVHFQNSSFLGDFFKKELSMSIGNEIDEVARANACAPTNQKTEFKNCFVKSDIIQIKDFVYNGKHSK